jgi:polyhydroxybutyrate depolymerase
VSTWNRVAIPFLGLAGAAGALGARRMTHGTPPAPPALKGRLQRGTLQTATADRRYLAYLPPDLAPGASLVLVFHPHGADGARMREITGFGFDRLADEHGFAVLYPDGLRGTWNEARREVWHPARRWQVDDIGFALELVRLFVESHDIDVRSVFAVGHSGGGQLVYRLALESPARFAGMAVVAAGLPTPDNLVSTPSGQPVPIMIINGTQDRLNPYNGGPVQLAPGVAGHGEVHSADATARYFAGLSGPPGDPLVSPVPHSPDSPGTTVTRSEYAPPGRPRTVLYTVHGGGHVLPQRGGYTPPRYLGRTTRDIDAPEVIWDFFAGLRAVRAGTSE